MRARRALGVVMVLAVALPAGSSPGGGNGFVDLWWTADQQGRRHFERGEHRRAAELFDDPVWQGAAYYRSGDYEQAADAFGRVATAEAAFNLGNAYAMLRRYPEAVAAYDAALAKRPDWIEVAENRDAVRALMPVDLEYPEEEQASGEPSFDADDMQFDEKGKQGKLGKVDPAQLSDQQLAEMWLRRLQTSPADFLRQRFAVEAASEEAP